MSSDEEAEEGLATEKPNGASYLLYGQDQLDAAQRATEDAPRVALEELGQLHAAGNPLVLHEVIRRSQMYELPLPKWAAKALMDQEVKLLNDPKRGKMGRHREKLVAHVRQRTYWSINLWLKDPRFYRGVPRSVIEKWYTGDIKHKTEGSPPKYGERALELSQEALAATFARTSVDRLREVRYKVPLKSKLAKMLRELDPSDDPDDLHYDLQEFLLREQLSSNWVFDEWEVEAKVGLLKDFFGPPGPPPTHIQVELDQFGAAHSEEGIFSEK